jgi:hypothetical protein
MESKQTVATHHPQGKVVQQRQEALTRAISGQSFSNFPAIFAGFATKGIPESEIKPRENVFTFQAWKAKGRFIRRGQHGVKIVTFIDCKSKAADRDTDKGKSFRRPWNITVFHVSQTDTVNEGAL